MPRTIETLVFSFEELSDRAKERARDWWREGNMTSNYWHNFIYEDAVTCGNILGIHINSKPIKLMNGETRYDPAIYFTGFSFQGDGACFEGSYEYAKGATKKIREHAPLDSELHRIADELQALQRSHFYRVTARTEHRGSYCNSAHMAVWATSPHDNIEIKLGQLLREFANWIYRQLEKEYEFQQSNEVVDETIRANEYEFDEFGNPA